MIGVTLSEVKSIEVEDWNQILMTRFTKGPIKSESKPTALDPTLS